jgi:S-layer protein (TIGR01567 family)
MEIKSAGSSGITMKNNDDVSLGEGEIVDLMENIKFQVADSSTLRFALYKEITEPGTHEIRGTVYNTVDKPTWTHMNFEGFYYDIDEDLGTERLEVKNAGTSIDDGNLAYTTTIQSIRFDYSGWGKYNVIGFMAEKCFAGYNSRTDSDITGEPISLVSHNLLSKVLIDSDKGHTVSTDAPLELEEGYKLKLIRLDSSGDVAQIELLQDGISVDTGIISNTPSTYVYTKDIGSIDDAPVIAIHVDSVSAGTEADTIMINGIFQISENCKSVEAGDRYGEMEITSKSSTGITMKNPDTIGLNEGGNTMIMGDIGFMTSDNGDRYCPFVRRTVGSIAALRIELPENPVVGEELRIRVTSDGFPVEGACVTFDCEYIGLTGSSGVVWFTPDATGTFTVTASKRNYNSASAGIWIIDGSTATADAVIALQLAVSGEWDADADVSGDGAVTSLDALMTLQMAMKDPGAIIGIVINELMPNPIGADRGNETTELYNCGDEPVDIGGWVLENEDGTSYTIPEGTAIEPHGYYLTTKIQLDNGDGYVLLYRDGEEVDRSIAYMHSTEGVSWQRRTDGLDTDSDVDWIERDPTFGVSG